MTVLVVGEHPEIDDVLARRHALGQDRFDEVWQGVYHMAPFASIEHGRVVSDVLYALEPRARVHGLFSIDGFNLGLDKNDFRVPDAGWVRQPIRGVYAPNAIAVLEVLSPEDETFAKFDFYLDRGVREILVAHPTEQWIKCYANNGERYVGQTASQVFAVSMVELVAQIRWP